jgi:hypothetical protein
MISEERLNALKTGMVDGTKQEKMAFEAFSAGLEVGMERQRMMMSRDPEVWLRLAEEGKPTQFDLWLRKGCPGI